MIFVACDHAGLELKQALMTKHPNLQFKDLGTFTSDSCDYPDYALKCAKSVLENPGSLGLLICGTGIGMAISANKVPGVRAASVSEAFSARMAREHNQAQILCLGARVVDLARASECLLAFLNAKVDSSERHARRVVKMMKLDELSVSGENNDESSIRFR